MRGAERVAYVARELGREDGEDLYFAYVASSDQDDAMVVDELGGVGNIGDALEWARERASRVVLSYGVSGEGVFSAGSVYYLGANAASPLPEWPPTEELRRRLDEQVMDARSEPIGGRIDIDEPEEVDR